MDVRVLSVGKLWQWWFWVSQITWLGSFVVGITEWLLTLVGRAAPHLPPAHLPLHCFSSRCVFAGGACKIALFYGSNRLLFIPSRRNVFTLRPLLFAFPLYCFLRDYESTPWSSTDWKINIQDLMEVRFECDRCINT